MIRTITVGSTVSIQGTFVRNIGNGHIEVRVGQQTFTGPPVSKAS
ncbi:MAG: hypothetical protein AAFP28_05930 [Pseudomonadota bacterium]